MQKDSGKRQASRTSAKTGAQSKAGARMPAATDPGAVISSIAYSLYEARGCVDGHALEDWLEAEARVSKGVATASADEAQAAVAG